MGSVLSVDLAYKRHRDIGVAVLEGGGKGLNCRFLDPALPDPPEAERLADWLGAAASRFRVRFLLIDGPQAWKHPGNGLEHCRVCERRLNTPSKTGPPGEAKPANYLPFTRFSISLFEALERRGWPRLRVSGERPSRAALEVFPRSAWTGLGLEPLPSKRRAKSTNLRARASDLEGMGVSFAQQPNHDQLQAAVAALAGEDFLRRASYRLAGAPLRRLDNHWCEGYILTTGSYQSGRAQSNPAR